MASKVQVTLVDDLDGTEATSTVEFGIDGVNYEIDLNDANAEKLRSVLAPFKEKARKVTARRRGRKGVSGLASERVSATEVRDWARSQGMEVSTRGRVPSEVIAAYLAAR